MPTDGARETRMAGAASYKGEKVGPHALQSWWLWSCQTAGSGGRGLNNKKREMSGFVMPLIPGVSVRRQCCRREKGVTLESQGGGLS